jgi:hypothetical protein
VCDGEDNNCNLAIDEDPVDGQAWWADVDDDGFGDPAVTGMACTPPVNTVTNSDDCAPAVALAFPGSHSIETPFDGIDQDCDGNDTCTDLNCDAYTDIIAPAHYDGDYSTISRVYFGDATGVGSSLSLTTGGGPMHSIALDYNNDGYLDVAMPNYNLSTVLLFPGSATGLSNATVITLPSDRVQGLCTADLNNDGFVELIAAGYYTGAVYTATSYIYWGQPGGYTVGNRTGLPSSGATQCLVDDFNRDTFLDLAFTQYYGGSSYRTDSLVYWGNAASMYSAASRTGLPTQGSVEAIARDLNGDGYPELVFSNHYNDTTYVVDSYIYWGSAAGYSIASRTALPTLGSLDVSAGDLDRDGDLDLVFGGYYNGSTYSVNSYIYWNAPTGFSTLNRTSLPGTGVYSVAIGDVNADGFLDVALGNYYDGSTVKDSKIYLNDNGTFDPADRIDVPTIGGLAVMAADFNGDGSDDVCFSGYYNNTIPSYFTTSVLYQGAPMMSSETFSTTGALSLTAVGPFGQVSSKAR